MLSNLLRKGGGFFKNGSSTLPYEQHKLNLGFLDLIVLSSYQSWAPQCSHTCVGGPKFIASVNFPTKKLEDYFLGT